MSGPDLAHTQLNKNCKVKSTSNSDLLENALRNLRHYRISHGHAGCSGIISERYFFGYTCPMYWTLPRMLPVYVPFIIVIGSIMMNTEKLWPTNRETHRLTGISSCWAVIISSRLQFQPSFLLAVKPCHRPIRCQNQCVPESFVALSQSCRQNCRWEPTNI